MKDFIYVYILVSETNSEIHYSGITDNLRERLLRHNSGRSDATAKYRPWRIETAIAFSSKKKARSFERYLKTESGREFSRRHF